MPLGHTSKRRVESLGLRQYRLDLKRLTVFHPCQRRLDFPRCKTDGSGCYLSEEDLEGAGLLPVLDSVFDSDFDSDFDSVFDSDFDSVFDSAFDSDFSPPLAEGTTPFLP